MKLRIFLILAILSLPFALPAADKGEAVSTKKERNDIKEGNALYNKGNLLDAMGKYQEALQENPSSDVARYNLGLTQYLLASNSKDTTATGKELIEKGTNYLKEVSGAGARNPQLAAKACYNLGNISFLSQDYANAENWYKQALRLNPEDNAARRNLRIAQLQPKQDQNQDQDKDQDQNQDKKEEQDKEQNQEQQNQDQDQDQNQQNQNNRDEQQNQPQPQELNSQTAEQILKAMENKENNTRAKAAVKQGEKSKGRRRNPRNW